MFRGAMRTDAPKHQVDGGRLEALWEVDDGEGHILKTVRLLALLTEEMGMLVVILFMVVAMTQLILHTLAAAFDDMDEVLRTKERQCTEDA